MENIDSVRLNHLEYLIFIIFSSKSCNAKFIEPKIFYLLADSQNKLYLCMIELENWRLSNTLKFAKLSNSLITSNY